MPKLEGTSQEMPLDCALLQLMLDSQTFERGQLQRLLSPTSKTLSSVLKKLSLGRGARLHRTVCSRSLGQGVGESDQIEALLVLETMSFNALEVGVVACSAGSPTHRIAWLGSHWARERCGQRLKLGIERPVLGNS